MEREIARSLEQFIKGRVVSEGFAEGWGERK